MKGESDIARFNSITLLHNCKKLFLEWNDKRRIN